MLPLFLPQTVSDLSAQLLSEKERDLALQLGDLAFEIGGILAQLARAIPWRSPGRSQSFEYAGETPGAS